MRAEFSEFSFGYALTEAFIWDIGLPMIGAPIFPNLFAEGQPGGGYDVRISAIGLPIFLQFKLSEVIIKRSKYLPPGFSLPYYRMYLRQRSKSDQHRLLLQLEQQGNQVFYAAPRFHTIAELNQHYLSRALILQSAYIKPSTIGRLPDDDEHYISFLPSGSIGYYYSEPKKLELPIDGGTMISNLVEVLGERAKRYSPEDFAKLAQGLLNILENDQIKSLLSESARMKDIFEQNPILYVSYLAQVFFHCRFMFIIREF